MSEPRVSRNTPGFGAGDNVARALDWERANRIANADPSTLNPLERVNRAATGLMCSGVGPIAGDLPGIVQGYLNYFCEPYWEEPGTFEPPFEGGQCDNIQYFGSIDITIADQDGQTFTSNRDWSGGAFGPISVSVVGNASGPGSTVFVRNGAGNNLVNFNTNPLSYVSYSLNLSTAPGIPDDCGNPPVEFTPPPAGDTYNYGDQITNNFGWGPTFIAVGPPVFSISGDVQFDVNIDGDILPIRIGDPTFNFGPRRPPTFSPSFTGGDIIINPPGEPVEVDLTDLLPEDEEAIYRAVGFSYQVTGPVGQPGAIANSDPIIYPRVVGNLQLHLAEPFTDDPETFWSEPIQIRGETGVITTPYPGLRIIGIAGNILPHLGLDIQLIFGET